jgi:modification methylase
LLPLEGDVVALDFMGAIIWRKISTTNTSGGGAWMGSMYYPKDGHVTYEHEYILLFRKQGEWSPPSDAEVKEKSRLTKEERQAWFRGVWDDIPPARQEGHIAMFPVELPRRLIRMYSFWGETVLDPFMGSGSTARAAVLEGRDSVGYEINPEHEALIRSKLGFGGPDLFGSGPEVDLQIVSR